jgi:hypothetical protein
MQGIPWPPRLSQNGELDSALWLVRTSAPPGPAEKLGSLARAYTRSAPNFGPRAGGTGKDWPSGVDGGGAKAAHQPAATAAPDEDGAGGQPGEQDGGSSGGGHPRVGEAVAHFPGGGHVPAEPHP